MVAHQLDLHQVLLLQTIYDYFHKVGEWPSWPYVASKVQSRMQSAFADVVGSLFPRYVHRIPTFDKGDGPASITVEGLRNCQGADEELSDFIRMIGLCVSLYFDPAISQPEISSKELRQRLAMPDLTVDKMLRLLSGEKIATEGGGTFNEWWYQIPPEIRRYHGVRSIDQYLERRPVPQAETDSVTTDRQETSQNPELTTDAEVNLAYDYLWVGAFIHDGSRPRIGKELAEEDQYPLHRVFDEYLKYLAAEMERIGLSPRTHPPFPAFSYLLGLTTRQLYIVVGPSLGIRLAIFKDLRAIVPPPTLDEVASACRQELVWDQTVAVEISREDLDSAIRQAQALQIAAREAAERMAPTHMSTIPATISNSLKRFIEDHPNPTATGFIIMSFENTRAHQQIAETIKSTLAQCGLEGIRADEKEYSALLYENVLTYMYGCGFAVAVFDRLTSESFNPNVAYEIGYMFALSKPVCLLKDKTLNTLQADLGGHLYKAFDPQNVRRSLPAVLRKWLGDYNLGKNDR